MHGEEHDPREAVAEIFDRPAVHGTDKRRACHRDSGQDEDQVPHDDPAALADAIRSASPFRSTGTAVERDGTIHSLDF